MSGPGCSVTGPAESFRIRPIGTIDEYHACEDLQRAAWGFESDLDIVPLTQLVAATRAGGLVLGAFDAEERLGGFCYSFLGRDAAGDLHYSHMTAVHPDLKAGGLGARLKWAQRSVVLDRGIERIVWTYDPLESLNGYFNFSKLGVLVDVYWENLYGRTASALHAGTPTDRFRAEWWLRSERVLARERGERSEPARALAAEPDGLPLALAAATVDPHAPPGVPRTDLDADRLLVQIPSSIQAVKKHAPEAALDWRMVTREVFGHYLGAGWTVVECVRTAEEPARTLYLLERRAPADDLRRSSAP